MLKHNWHTVIAFIVDSAPSRIRLADNLDDFKVEALASLEVAAQATLVTGAGQFHFLVFFGGFFVFLP